MLVFTGQFDLRRARLADLEFLVRICEDSFPYSARWSCMQRGPGKEWWQIVFNSDHCETWVGLIDGAPIAFAVLVNNERAFRQEMHHKGAKQTLQLLFALANPRFVVARLRDIFLGNNCEMQVDSEKQLPVGERLYVELIAVSSGIRGRGVGRRLIKHVQIRAQILGKQGTYYLVRRTNRPMNKLIQSMDFTLIGKSRSNYLYCISLDENYA